MKIAFFSILISLLYASQGFAKASPKKKEDDSVMDRLSRMGTVPRIDVPLIDLDQYKRNYFRTNESHVQFIAPFDFTERIHYVRSKLFSNSRMPFMSLVSVSLFLKFDPTRFKDKESQLALQERGIYIQKIYPKERGTPGTIYELVQTYERGEWYKKLAVFGEGKHTAIVGLIVPRPYQHHRTVEQLSLMVDLSGIEEKKK